MFSLLDFRLWIALALALVATYVAGDRVRAAADQREWHAREALIAAETAERLAAATEQVRLTERAMSTQLAAVETQHVKEMEHARSENARLVADIRTRRLRLYVPTRPAGNTADHSDPAFAGGNRGEARTELDPTLTETLIGIATEGDTAIRQLNACIDAYEGVRGTPNLQRECIDGSLSCIK